MLTFEWHYTFYLLPLPLLVYLFYPKAKRSNRAILAPFYTRIQSLPSDAHNNITRASLYQWLPLILIWLLFVIASARPLWLSDPLALPASGRDLLIAVDISESMKMEDMVAQGQNVQRIDAVKAVVREFIVNRKNDRIGLILFGSRAYLQSPLTFDHATVARFLEEAQLGFAGEQTAIGDAIGLGIKRLAKVTNDSNAENPNNENHSRVIILLTDGANTAGEITPLQGAELAQYKGIKIYTVGIGADEMLISTILGPRRINPSAALDEKTLAAIAENTGGKYFRARDTEQLATIYQLLDTLEPIEQADQTVRGQRSLFMYPLALALILSLSYARLAQQRYNVP